MITLKSLAVDAKQDKLDILFNSQPYTIDFAQMQEFSVSSGRSVPISGKLISSVDLYTEFQATAFGQGVYFAVKSSYSLSDTYSPPNADGHKFIFVARVLTGDFTQGKHDMRAAPLREGSGMPMRFHSVVDNVKEPSLFVIFNDTQAYPQYLITCLKAPE
ncbi:hypothetical protein PGIGA_G00137990 [Pangasianodon gigas]|uniref:Uncharacterized protein n=1 Tax=Pangasianodon gigas TaxID=30993 RepID=A0ACC5XKW8_PANGG|nr:hypothetical protein [Pangasianodon gigas]